MFPVVKVKVFPYFIFVHTAWSANAAIVESYSEKFSRVKSSNRFGKKTSFFCVFIFGTLRGAEKENGWVNDPDIKGASPGARGLQYQAAFNVRLVAPPAPSSI